MRFIKALYRMVTRFIWTVIWMVMAPVYLGMRFIWASIRMVMLLVYLGMVLGPPAMVVTGGIGFLMIKAEEWWSAEQAEVIDWSKKPWSELDRRTEWWKRPEHAAHLKKYIKYLDIEVEKALRRDAALTNLYWGLLLLFALTPLGLVLLGRQAKSYVLRRERRENGL